MTYTHLSQDERYQIYAFKQASFSLRAIAKQLGRSTSTISRELIRNKGLRGYRPKQAHELSARKATHSRNASIISVHVFEQAHKLIESDYSPEQAGHEVGVSHETLYRYIYADKAAGGNLYKHLRCQKKRRKRYGSGRSKRGQIVDRVGIGQRPARVDTCKQVGDWEIDTIMGANHQGAIVSIVERKTGFALIELLDGKNADGLAQAVIKMLQPYKQKIKTITSDNGKEFAMHAQISNALKCKWYFADPYCSWQRGCNENYNGLVRQYIPKKTKLESVSKAQIAQIQKNLNNRPRKRLGYKTPADLFNKSLRRVALRL
jgi:IS30 family transposase